MSEQDVFFSCTASEGVNLKFWTRIHISEVYERNPKTGAFLPTVQVAFDKGEGPDSRYTYTGAVAEGISQRLGIDRQRSDASRRNVQQWINRRVLSGALK